MRAIERRVMEILKVREEFEKAAIDRHVFGCSLDREIVSGVDQYKHPHLNACWLFWLAGAAIAPPVAAGSVGVLQRFEPVEAQHGTGYMIYWGNTMEEDADGEWVKHADAIVWGAQQLEQGKAEQTSFLKECMDRGQTEFNRKWTEQKERAEKAEARVEKLKDDLESVKRARWEQAYEIQALKDRIESTPPFVPMGGIYAQKKA